MNVLEVEDLTLHYRTVKGPVKAVDGVSFEVEEGHTLAVVGESGCGKTSTASALLRMLPKNVARYEGKVILDGTDVMKMSDGEFRKQVRWKGISMVFQGAMNALNPTARVGKQVAEPLKIHTDIEDEEARGEAREALRSTGLAEFVEKSYPHELSGGMKQRAIIAMALILRPKLVILDEPTSALDVMTQANIINLLKRLKREEGLSYIFITHDLGLASELADELLIMYAGEAVEVGPAEMVYEKPHHPYTQSLLQSVPRLRSKERPISIPGVPPDLVAPPLGCRFHPRCPVSFQECGWGAEEVAESLKGFFREDQGEEDGVLDGVEVRDDLTLILPSDNGVDLRERQRTLRSVIDSERETVRALQSVKDVRIEDGALVVMLHDRVVPWMIGEKQRAACLLLREGEGKDG